MKITRLVLMLVALVALNTPSFAVSLPAASHTTTEPDPATVKSALNEFSSLSKKEKKERLQEVKKAIKQYKAAISRQGSRYKYSVVGDPGNLIATAGRVFA